MDDMYHEGEFFANRSCALCHRFPARHTTHYLHDYGLLT
jgi:hypothetical protein